MLALLLPAVAAATDPAAAAAAACCLCLCLAAVYLMGTFVEPEDGGLFGARVSGSNCSCGAFITAWDFSYFKACAPTDFQCQGEPRRLGCCMPLLVGKGCACGAFTTGTTPACLPASLPASHTRLGCLPRHAAALPAVETTVTAQLKGVQYEQQRPLTGLTATCSDGAKIQVSVSCRQRCCL